MYRPSIRPIALAIIIWRDHLLANRYPHPEGTFYRPIGGGIEFGETAEAAVRREALEEIGRTIEVTERLAVSENLFELDGEPGHQIVFEFLARWPDGQEPTDFAPLEGSEQNGEPIDARWLPLERVLAGEYVLYPDGLADRLSGWMRG